MKTEQESLCCRDNSEIPEENYDANFFVFLCITQISGKTL